MTDKTSKQSPEVAGKQSHPEAAIRPNGDGSSSVGKPVKAAAKKRSARPPATTTRSTDATVATTPKLLTGGNPQIPKEAGDAPVQAFIAAMPGWKSAVGRRLDALIERTVPGVIKAVKWNTPLYGVEGQGWFMAYNCCTKYVKITFFRGRSLTPIPPGESKQAEVRYLNLYEDDELDEVQLAAWVQQASELPGERL